MNTYLKYVLLALALVPIFTESSKAQKKSNLNTPAVNEIGIEKLESYLNYIKNLNLVDPIDPNLTQNIEDFRNQYIKLSSINISESIIEVPYNELEFNEYKILAKILGLEQKNNVSKKDINAIKQEFLDIIKLFKQHQLLSLLLDENIYSQSEILLFTLNNNYTKYEVGSLLNYRKERNISGIELRVQIEEDIKHFNKLINTYQEKLEVLLSINPDFRIESTADSKIVFNQNNRDKLDFKTLEIKTKFSEIGINQKKLKDQLAKYKLVRGEKEILQNQLEDDIKNRIWITGNGTIIKREVLAIHTDNQIYEGEFIALFPNKIYTQFKKGSDIDNVIKKIKNNLNRKILKDEIEILSFIKDKSTENLLNETFHHQTIKFKISQNKENNISKLNKILKKKKGKTIFIIGHIEDNNFVTYHSGKEIMRINILDLLEMCEELNISFFPFGCNSAVTINGKIGSTSILNSYSDTKALISAIKSNDNVMGVLSDFCSNDKAIVIDASTFSDKNYSKFVVRQKVKKGAVISLISSGVIILSRFCYSKDCEEKEKHEKAENKENRND